MMRRAPGPVNYLVSMSRGKVLASIGVGVAAGFTSGLFGVGGGVVMVPLLVALGLSQHDAHATSLAAGIPLAAVGALTFAADGAVDLGFALALATGALFGSQVGARIMARTPEAPLKVAFGCVIVGVAVVMLVL